MGGVRGEERTGEGRGVRRRKKGGVRGERSGGGGGGGGGGGAIYIYIYCFLF